MALKLVSTLLDNRCTALTNRPSQTSTKVTTAPFGPSHSHLTTTCMPRDPRTARSRCGRTARASTDYGVVPVALLLRNGAPTRRSKAVRSHKQPPWSWTSGTINWLFLSRKQLRRVSERHYRPVLTSLSIDRHPPRHSHCRPRATILTDSSSWKNFSDGCASGTFPSAATRRTDGLPSIRHPPLALNSQRLSSNHPATS